MSSLDSTANQMSLGARGCLQWLRRGRTYAASAVTGLAVQSVSARLLQRRGMYFHVAWLAQRAGTAEGPCPRVDIWEKIGPHLVPTCSPRGPHMVPTWSPLGPHVVPTWFPPGIREETTWGPRADHVGTSWGRRGDRVGPTWGPRGGHVGTTCEPPRCSPPGPAWSPLGPHRAPLGPQRVPTWPRLVPTGSPPGPA